MLEGEGHLYHRAMSLVSGGQNVAMFKGFIPNEWVKERRESTPAKIGPIMSNNLETVRDRMLVLLSMSYYYLLRLRSFYFPDQCKCYLFSLLTPVHSVHVFFALFC